MTKQEQHSEFESVSELLGEQGLDGMREAMEALINETKPLRDPDRTENGSQNF